MYIKKSARCEECEKRKAKYVCPECGLKLCEECNYEGTCPECAPPMRRFSIRKQKKVEK